MLKVVDLFAGIYCLQEKIKEWKACPEYLEADNYFDLDLASFLVKKQACLALLYTKTIFKKRRGWCIRSMVHYVLTKTRT